ncbi:MAG: SpoIIE family protein phosphatase [Phycisphaerales bacterium]|nr:MAG: SpoIIE family protein phosphatase [Phycisphaerales bacterium]
MPPHDPVEPGSRAAATPALPTNPVQLLDLVDVALVQELQDSFAALGELSIQICDARGQPITDPSCRDAGCRVIASTEAGRAACRTSATEAAAKVRDACEAVQTCHCGMTQYGAPINALGQRLGTVVAGKTSGKTISRDRLRSIAKTYGLDADRLAEAVIHGAEHALDSAARLPHVLARVVAALCEQRFEIRQRLEEISTVCDVTGMLSGTGDLSGVMARAAARASQAMGVKAATIRLVDQETGELVLHASHNLSDEYLAKGAVTLAANPVDRAAIEGETVYIEDAATDPRVRYGEAARREGLVSSLCVPMSYRGEVVGVLRIYSDRRQRFSGLEAALLRAIGSQIAAAVTHTRLYEQRLANERYTRQLAYAADIQQRMIPEPPRHPRITFGAIYDPHLGVGGDFYDFLHLPGGTLGVCIADVAGKGMPAALLMASVRAGLRAHADSTFNINDIITKVNDRLYRDTLVSEFATLFYGVFSADGAQLTYCNAGHEPPVLLRGDHIFQLRTGGMVIGLDPHEKYRMDVVDLKGGDIIAMVTDGVTEALNFDDEPFGRRRLIESIRRYRDLEAPSLAQQLLWDVRRFAGLADKLDDLTLVVAKVG